LIAGLVAAAVAVALVVTQCDGRRAIPATRAPAGRGFTDQKTSATSSVL
jgi:hypothetical protein